jgi:hypothetical protein
MQQPPPPPSAKPADAKPAPKPRVPPEVDWVDASLRSVPVSIIQHCIAKAQRQRDELARAGSSGSAAAPPAAAAAGAARPTALSTSVVVHMARGGYRYRAVRLASMDAAMNMRLEDVVVSRASRRIDASALGRDNADSSAAAAAPGTVVLTRLPLGGRAAAVAASRSRRDLGSAAATAHAAVPPDEEAVGVRRGTFVPGSSVMMIELPPEWSEVFDAQARAVQREVRRRADHKRHAAKERRRRRAAQALEKRRERKATRTAKVDLLRKGEKRARAAKHKAP